MKLKKLILALVFSIALAVSSVDNRSLTDSSRPAIIYQIKQTTDYSTRKKTLKMPRFAIRNMQ